MFQSLCFFVIALSTELCASKEMQRNSSNISLNGYNQTIKHLHEDDQNLNMKKTWLLYMLTSLKESTLYLKQRGYDINNLKQMKFELVQRVFAYKMCKHSKDKASNLNLHTPCSYVYFNSWTPTSRSWSISVHQLFMINITIYKSFVPYSDSCSPHNVQIHEGHNLNNDSLIELFCGHTYMESVYTRYNKGLLHITFDTIVIYSAVTLHAGYQIHDQGVAYRYHMDDTHLPLGSIVNIQTSLNLQHTVTTINIWYLSNQVYSSLKESGHDPELWNRQLCLEKGKCKRMRNENPLITHVQQDILTYRCSQNSSHIEIFHGMLSYYLIKWKLQPYATVYCNTLPHTILHHGMYFTVVLQWSTVDLTTFINMNFNFKLETEIPHLPIPYNGEIQYFTDDSLNNYGTIKFAFIRCVHGVLTFTSFDFTGESPSTRQALVATGGLEVVTDLQRQNFTQGTVLYSIFSL